MNWQKTILAAFIALVMAFALVQTIATSFVFTDLNNDYGANQITQAAKWGANLNAYDNSRTPLIYAAERGNEKLAKALIDSGADPNLGYLKESGNPVGMPPLVIAAGEGFSDVVKVLVDGGANVHAVDEQGQPWLVLDDFKDYRHRRVFEILRAAGVK